jgi:Na+-transporting methylmalonyl-CoA/oxaloacetate decarboxylase gamma subunit
MATMAEGFVFYALTTLILLLVPMAYFCNMMLNWAAGEREKGEEEEVTALSDDSSREVEAVEAAREQEEPRPPKTTKIWLCSDGPARRNVAILRSEHDVAKEDVLEKLLEDTDGINRRGSFLELIGDDLEVLVMLNLAYEDLEKARKLGKVGRFGNLLYFPLDSAGFPVSRGYPFSSFKKKGYDVPQLEKLISGRIRHTLLDMGCEFYC